MVEAPQVVGQKPKKLVAERRKHGNEVDSVQMAGPHCKRYKVDDSKTAHLAFGKPCKPKPASLP